MNRLSLILALGCPSQPPERGVRGGVPLHRGDFLLAFRDTKEGGQALPALTAGPVTSMQRN